MTTLHGDAGRRHVGDLDGVVLAGVDGIRQVEADLLGVHVESRDELDVTHVVVAELDVHQPGTVLRVSIGVEVDALHERGRAVTYADDGNADGTMRFSLVLAGS